MKSRDRNPMVRHGFYLCQAVFIYALYGLFACLPLDTASHVGGWLGRTIGTRLGLMTRARRNLDFIWPDMPAAQQDVIIRGMCDNIGRVAAEAPHLDKLYQQGRITLNGIEHLHTAQKAQRPVVFLCGHFANWEVGPIATWHNGTPLAVVYRKPNNPYADFLVRHTRRHVAPYLFMKGPDGARGMMRHLRDGNAVGLLTDQKMREGIAVPLLGHDAMTVTAPMTMALKTNAVLLPATVTRHHGAHFTVDIGAPLTTAMDQPFDTQIADLARQMNDLFSAHITAYPAQWLWLHRRWGCV